MLNEPVIFFGTRGYEKAIADVEKAIIKSLERQYADVLAPLKDSLAPKIFGKYVQKFTKGTASTYIVPNEVKYVYMFCWFVLFYCLQLKKLLFSVGSSFEFHEKDTSCIALQDRIPVQIMVFLHSTWWDYNPGRASHWNYGDAKGWLQKLYSSNSGETCRECEYHLECSWYYHWFFIMLLETSTISDPQLLSKIVTLLGIGRFDAFGNVGILGIYYVHTHIYIYLCI